jgi:hypothetical protein
MRAEQPERLPAAPSPAPSYYDREAWLDLWLHMHGDRDPRRPPEPSYRESITRGMRIVSTGRDPKRRKRIDAEGREEILKAIGDIMAARKVARDAADKYLTARAVLDGAIYRRSGEEAEDEGEADENED